MLTILTPTGERLEAFALCARMMARQTYKRPVHWIIVDDGREPVPLPRIRNWRIEIIRPEPLWVPGANTQGRNLRAGLDAMASDAVLTVVEDDDYYASGWLQWVADNAPSAELIGEGEAIYYNVRRRRWRQLGNTEHASLRCSAMRGAAIDAFRDVLATPYRYYDLKLWAQHGDRKVFPRRLTVGMKGMPGRPGIALGHDGRGNDDASAAKLCELIGDDADWYLPFFDKEGAMEKLIVTKPFRYAKRNWRVGEEFQPESRLDGELHMHARKVKKVSVSAPPSPRRELRVETQTEKMHAETVVKTDAPDDAEKPKKSKLGLTSRK